MQAASLPAEPPGKPFFLLGMDHWLPWTCFPMKQAELQQCWVCLRVGGVGTRGFMKVHFGLWPPAFGAWA